MALWKRNKEQVTMISYAFISGFPKHLKPRLIIISLNRRSKWDTQLSVPPKVILQLANIAIKNPIYLISVPCLLMLWASIPCTTQKGDGQDDLLGLSHPAVLLSGSPFIDCWLHLDKFPFTPFLFRQNSCWLRGQKEESVLWLFSRAVLALFHHFGSQGRLLSPHNCVRFL